MIPRSLAGVKKKFFPLFALIAACNLQANTSESRLPQYVDQAPLPESWPEPGPYDQVTEKSYPAYRAAFTDGKGQQSAFWTIFHHIANNEIKMTAPVEIPYPANHPSNRFLYQNGRVGSLGADGTKVEVRDVPSAEALSYAWKGNDSKENIAKARGALETALEQRSIEAKAFRMLGYNGPQTPRHNRGWELQAILR